MWYGGGIKKDTKPVSDSRLNGMNAYIEKNRNRNDHEALQEIIDLIPEFLILQYDKHMVPAGIIRG